MRENPIIRALIQREAECGGDPGALLGVAGEVQLHPPLDTVITDVSILHERLTTLTFIHIVIKPSTAAWPVEQKHHHAQASHYLHTSTCLGILQGSPLWPVLALPFTATWREVGHHLARHQQAEGIVARHNSNAICLIVCKVLCFGRI